VDDLEATVLESGDPELRSQLALQRRKAILLHRYLSPQREALQRMSTERISWLTEVERSRLREVNDRLIRHIENLDATRDRAALAQEEVASRTAEQLNGRMYVLSVVAAIFLPLGFLTGLLGVNLGGIPGAENPYAFLWFVAVLLVLVLSLLGFFLRRQWINTRS
jgi:zinc transporter